MSRITELILGILIALGCMLVMTFVSDADADADRSYREHRATIAAEQQWGQP